MRGKKNAWRHERNLGGHKQSRAPSSASTIDMDRYALGVDIVIRSKTGDVPAVEYAPIGAMRDEIACAVICAPGSSGGCGPGIAQAFRGLPLERRCSAAAHGSFYARLGIELSTGEDLDSWNPPKRRFEGVENDENGFPENHSVDSKEKFLSRGRRRPGAVCLQMTWSKCAGGRKWPGKRLKRVDALSAAVDDVVSCALYVRQKYGDGLRVVLVGFSFGGPACWAAARRLGSERLAAVVSVAGSARGGERFAKVHLDTEGCVKALDAVPRLWLHGTKDENVVPAISRRHFALAAEPKAVAWVVNGTHHFDHARAAGYEPLREFLVQVCQMECNRRRAGDVPYALDRPPPNAHPGGFLTKRSHVLVMPMCGKCSVIESHQRNAASRRRVINTADGSLATKTTAMFRGMAKAQAREEHPIVVQPGPDIPEGYGAGWVDVAASDDVDEVGAEAKAASMNRCVKPATLETLRKPEIKGYSE